MTKPILRECPHCGKILPPSHRQPRAQKSKIEVEPDSWSPLIERYRLQNPGVALTGVGIAEGIGVLPLRSHLARIGRVLRALGYIKHRKLPHDIYVRPEDVLPQGVVATRPRQRLPDPLIAPLVAWLAAPDQHERAVTLEEAVKALGVAQAEHGHLVRIGRILQALGRRRAVRYTRKTRVVLYEPGEWTSPARSAS